MSTDEHGTATGPRCAHCGAAFEPGHITCPRCGQARQLGAVDTGSTPAPAPIASAAAPTTTPDDEADEFDLGDPFRDVVRRRPRGPAQRSRTTLLIGGLIGLILVALVAAAALWALGQHGGSPDF